MALKFENNEMKETDIVKKTPFDRRKVITLALSSIIVYFLQFLPLTEMMAFLFLFINLIFIGIFGDLLVDSAHSLAKKIKVSAFIIGLILLPAISSLPENLITVFSNLANKNIGNVILAQILGNNLFELLVIFGISGFLACSYKKACIYVKNKMIVIRNGIMLFFATILLSVLILFDRNLTFVDGLVLLLFYALFLIFLYFSNKTDIKDEMTRGIDDYKALKTIYVLAITLIFLGGVVLFSDLFVSDLLYLFERVETFEKFSFLIIGIAVAIPDLILAVVGILKEKNHSIGRGEGQRELVLGFVIGGAIWDLIISIALQGIINPIYNISDTVTIFLVIVSIIGVSIALIYIRTKWVLRLWEALCLIALYIVIFIIILMLV